MDYRTKAIIALIPPENRICPKCNKPIKIEDAEVNHKDGKRYHNNVENLELIHKKCHRNVSSKTTVMINFRCPEDLLEKLDKRAEKLQINQSELIRKILRKGLSNTSRQT